MIGITQIAAHRGGALLWPENSRIAFENAARLPVDQVEFDIHPSRDGHLVVIHDATLERTSDGQGAVADHHWADLRTLVLKGTGGQRMLLLEEVIEILRPAGITLRIEIKADAKRRPYPGLPQVLVERLRALQVLERSVITSFQIGTLREVARHSAPRRLIWLVSPAVQADIGGAAGIAATVRAFGIEMVGLHQSMIEPLVIAALRDAGIRVGAWAVNDAAAIRRMFAAAVEVFTTDRPDLALSIRSEARAEQA